MKIEKVNDNQIRCTLTREDLADRQIKLSELAYGSEKAKMLFKDMMQQASAEFGFEAEDIPLMIEAVPLSAETIMLIITKVETPEELDTRFSNFSNHTDYDEPEDSVSDGDNPFQRDPAQEIFDLFQRIRREKESDGTDNLNSHAAAPQTSEDKDTAKETTKMFSFDSLDTAFQLSQLLKGFYTGDNALYKDERDNTYRLVVRQGAHSLSEFYKVYNTIAGYARPETYTPGCEAYYKEHCKVILPTKALQELTNI